MNSMQSARLPSIPALCSPSRKYRLDVDHPKYGLNVKVSQSTTLPNWAFLPSPPMSGSPPPEERKQLSQLAGNRRKRSESPPIARVFGPGHLPQPDPRVQESIVRGQRDETRKSSGSSDVVVQHGQSLPSYPPVQSYNYSSSIPPSLDPTSSTESQPRAGLFSPRTTRKTKAHVASACVNCKRKHLKCENIRPCPRCIQIGKESSCFDVEHKKRGRPPLKPEDSSSRRSFETALSPMPSSLTDPSRHLRAPGPSLYQYPPANALRDIRPTQTTGGPDGRAVPRLRHPLYPAYAAPSISHSSATALGTIIPPNRAFSNEPSSASTLPATPYSISPAGFSTMTGENVPRTLPHGAGGYLFPPQPTVQPMQQHLMMSPGQQYNYSLFGRPQAQPAISPSDGPSFGPYGPSLQLPPIRPPPPGTATQPAMAQLQQRQILPQENREAFIAPRQQPQPQPQQHQALQTQEHQARSDDQAKVGTTRQPDPKRPRMDIRGILDARND